MAKVNKDILMKVGIAAAVVLIIYLVYRSRSAKCSRYAEYVPDAPVRDDEYAENMFAGQEADYAEEDDDDYAEEDDDDYAEDDYAEEDERGRMENFTLMQSTLDDDQANAMFEPEN